MAFAEYPEDLEFLFGNTNFKTSVSPQDMLIVRPEHMDKFELVMATQAIVVVQEHKLVIGTGCVLWPCGQELFRILNELHLLTAIFAGRTVIELGAGCGSCGIMASFCGASRVVCTDFEEVLPLLLRNFDANATALRVGSHCNPTASTLDWNSDFDCCKLFQCAQFDVILCFDLLYVRHGVPDPFGPLASTLARLTSPETLLILGFQERAGISRDRVQVEFLDGVILAALFPIRRVLITTTISSALRGIHLIMMTGSRKLLQE